MSLNSLFKRIEEANKICESAATSAALTDQMAAPTTFTIPTEGINIGQLTTTLKTRVGPTVDIQQEGDNLRIVTNNPAVATVVLKEYGISTTVLGDVVANTHTQK